MHLTFYLTTDTATAADYFFDLFSFIFFQIFIINIFDVIIIDGIFFLDGLEHDGDSLKIRSDSIYRNLRAFSIGRFTGIIKTFSGDCS